VWNRSAYFPNHEADLLRLLTLERAQNATVYVDTDVLFVAPLHLEPDCQVAVGIEEGSGGRALPEQEEIYHSQSRGAKPSAGAALCNAVFVAAAGAALPRRAVHAFVSHYVPLTPGISMLELHARGEWGAMGPGLLSALLADPAPEECIYEREAFYPIRPGDAHRAFGPWRAAEDDATWGRIHARSVAVHYWNALTKAVPVTCGGLMHRLMTANCVLCEPVDCVNPEDS
jgi:hypothetical protein